MTIATRPFVKGDLQDSVREALLSYGERDVYISVSDLASKTGYNYSPVYQALYRLQNLGEVKLLHEDESSERSTIIGVRLLKMEPKEQITERLEEHKTAAYIVRQANKMDSTVKANVPTLLEYVKRRLAVERARQQLADSDLNPQEIIRFEPDPLGEEAMMLYQELTNIYRDNLVLKEDARAAQQNAETWKRRYEEARIVEHSGT